MDTDKLNPQLKVYDGRKIACTMCKFPTERSHWDFVSRLYSSCSGNTVREEILPVEFIILHRTILDYNASQYRTLIYVTLWEVLNTKVI